MFVMSFKERFLFMEALLLTVLLDACWCCLVNGLRGT